MTTITASFDPDPAESKKVVLKFLEQSKATFPNYILDDDVEVIGKKWEVIATPSIVIFDRKGNRMATLVPEADQPLMERAEKIVSKLLAEKSP